MTEPVQLETVPIADRHIKLGFRCGKAPLDDYFAKHALTNDRRGIGKTFVLERDEKDATLPEVIGFYTLGMAQLAYDMLPDPKPKALPRYPMPVALIGRLAVHEKARGRRFGERLLSDALDRILTVEQQIGCFGVIVDAKDAGARAFYAKYDFTVTSASGTFPLRMFIPIQTVRTARSSS